MSNRTATDSSSHGGEPSRRPAARATLFKVFYGTRVQADGTIHPSDIDGRKMHTGPYSSTNWLGLTYSPSNGGQFLQAFEYNGTIYTMQRTADLSAIDATFTTKSARASTIGRARLLARRTGG